MFAPPRRSRLIAAFAMSASFAWASLAGLRTANAEPSTWFYAGAGAADLNFRPEETPMLIQVETGLGSPAKHGFVVGGLFQFHGYLANGIDLGGALRFTHKNFVLGGWGAGLDLGFYQRWWGGDSTGASARLVLGAPLGLTASIGGTLGSNDQQVISATLGIDFARLTVHRNSLLDWWNNPFPPETGDEGRAQSSSTPDWRF